MSVYLGRAGKTLALPEPMRWAANGRTVTLSGNLSITSPVGDALRLRDQILGYDGNFDEEVVPVIVDGEPRLNGYYRPLGIQVPTDPALIARGLGFYTATLEAVPGFAAPTFESVITGALLSNVVGAVTGDMIFFHAVPSSVMDYYKGTGGTVYTRASADGNLRFFTGGTVSDTARFSLAPADYYVGAATFEQGSSFQPVVGRQLVQNDVTNWRLSNGLVRVTLGAFFGLSWYNGSTWSAVKNFTFGGINTSGVLSSVQTIRVLRNSPEEVVVRLACRMVFGVDWGRVNVDISLRRGDRLARFYLTADKSDNYFVQSGTATACTAVNYGAVTTGGIRATANDGDGNRFVLISYQKAVTSDLVNGFLTQNALQTTMDIGIGSEVGGSGAVAPNRAVDIAQQYLAAQSEKQLVVTR